MEAMKIYFSWAPKSLWKMTAVMKLKDACSLEGRLPRQHISKKRHQFVFLKKKKLLKSTLCFFPVVMYEYESRTIKKAEY